MDDRDKVKRAYEQIRPSQELLNKTSTLMKVELRNQQEKPKKTPILLRKHIRQIAVVTCMFAIIVGIHIYNMNQPQISPDSNKILMGKVKVNVSGQIEEVSEDGYSFRLNGIWYLVNDDTRFLSQSGEEVSKVFEVGNIISAYTSQENQQDNRLVDTVFANEK
ncbi:hypothetical protein [Vallitalea okinawensis]|uniref:hypothetical protein n=1 Tax=Vallitalea okinawensis TaxID=2078660 RepID=UPI000CFC101B|nr:hypothetical protein [Vallitalea okinawensis]